eukprot:SAG31_NODE_27385_length_426_cov_7.311927_1_plen_73_part_01
MVWEGRDRRVVVVTAVPGGGLYVEGGCCGDSSPILVSAGVQDVGVRCLTSLHRRSSVLCVWGSLVPATVWVVS